MKIWMIVAMVGMLAIAGFAVVNALDTEEVAEVISNPTCGGNGPNPSCAYQDGSGKCDGAGSCGNSQCGLKDGTGSGKTGCGCGK